MSGRIYEGFGPSGDTFEGMRRDLEGIWDPVWRHEVMDDIEGAIRRLEVEGAFATGTVPPTVL